MTKEEIKKRSASELESVKDQSTKKHKSITDFFSKPVKSASSVNKVDGLSEKEDIKGTINELDHIKFKQKFFENLTNEQRELLQLEFDTLEDSWFEALHKELLKPYFLDLKRFLLSQKKANVQVFPLENDIYSWSKLTPLSQVKVIMLGQDPYHNVNQAHGLAFSVKEPTPPPPSLKNIYKALKIDYPEFEIPKTGDLTKWAEQGVLLLNTCLTVKAHNANSHAKKGWEKFTEKAIEQVISRAYSKNLALFLWGTPAHKRVDNLKLNLKKENFLVLKSVHPSPLSASRGYFDGHHYKLGNEWLISRGEEPIQWSLVDGNSIDYHK